ncbi:CW-type Zinc Finger, partial [Ostertagia ostertagi]
EYLSLLRAMNDHMEQYWKDINLAGSDGPSGIKSFWKNFGYENSDWSSECTNLAEHRKKRFLRIGHTIQCDKCLKWRHVEYHAPYEINGIPEKWCCDDHPNSMFRGCSRPEEIPKGRGMDRKPDIPNRSTPSAAAANGSGLARRPVTSVSTPAPTQKIKEVQRRKEPSPVPSRPLKRSSRVAQRREELTSESESSPERPPRKVATKAVIPPNKSSERVSAVGRPPTKRAAAAISTSKNRRVISSEDESDEEEPITVPDLPKKPKTKADLRRQYEENEKLNEKKAVVAEVKAPPPTVTRDVRQAASSSTAQPSTATPAKPSTSFTKPATSVSTPPAAPLSNGTVGKGSIDKEAFDREKDRADRAVGQTRKLLNFFLKQGVSYADRFRRMGEDELLEQDMEQFGRNLWEEHVLKVCREQMNCECFVEATKSKCESFEFQPDDVVTYENCFQMKDKLLGMLNADPEESEESSQQSEVFAPESPRADSLTVRALEALAITLITTVVWLGKCGPLVSGYKRLERLYHETRFMKTKVLHEVQISSYLCSSVLSVLMSSA